MTVTPHGERIRWIAITVALVVALVAWVCAFAAGAEDDMRRLQG